MRGMYMNILIIMPNIVVSWLSLNDDYPYLNLTILDVVMK